MKKRILCAFILVLAAVALATMFVACDPAKGTVTFFRGGVGEDVILAGEAGADISEDIPSASNTRAYYFGGWYESADFEGEAVEPMTSLPSGEKAYYARWYRKYSVDVLLEDAEGNFVKSEELSFEGEANKGEEIVELDFAAPAGYDETTDDKSVDIAERDNSVQLRYALKTVTVTFVQNGGLDDIEVRAKRTTDIAGDVPALEDTQELFFGGWYLDDEFNERAEDMSVAPDEDATYYARWYRTYKISAYMQNAAHTGYDKFDEAELEANEDIESVTADGGLFETPDGYLPPKEATLTLDSKSGCEGALYYDRDDVKVTYHLGGELGDAEAYARRGTTYLPDRSLEIFEELAAAGKHASFYDAQGALITSGIEANADIEISVRFTEGMEERNGSYDLLFLPEDEPDKAYIFRDGIGEIEGEYNAQTKMFAFDGGELTGRAYSDGTFAMKREGAVSFALYDGLEDKIIDGVTLALDWLDGATLTVAESAADILCGYAERAGAVELVSVPAGKYECAYLADIDYGDMFITIELDGEEFALHFIVGEYESKDGKLHDVFVQRGEEFGLYEDESALILLDGYGETIYFVGEAYTTGVYGFYEEDEHLPGMSIVAASYPEGDVSFIAEAPQSMSEGLPYRNIYRYDGLDGNYEELNPFAQQGGYGYGTLYVSGYGIAALDTGDGKEKLYDYEIQMGGLLTYNFMAWVKLYDRGTGEYAKDAFFTLFPNAYYFEMPQGAEFCLLSDLRDLNGLMYLDGKGNVHYFTYEGDYETYLYYGGDDGTIEEAGVDELGRQLYSATFPHEEMNVTYFETVTADGIKMCYKQGTRVLDGEFEDKNGAVLTLDSLGYGTYVGADGIAHSGQYFDNADGTLLFACFDYVAGVCPVLFDFTVEGESFEVVQPEELPPTLYHFQAYMDDEGNTYIAYNAVMSVSPDFSAVINVPLTDDHAMTIIGRVRVTDPINSYFSFEATEVSEAATDAFTQTLATGFAFCLVGYSTQNGDMYGFSLSDGFEKAYALEDGSVFSMDGFGLATYKTKDGYESFGGYTVYTDTTYLENGDRHVHYIFSYTDVDGYETLFDLWDDGSLTRRGREFSWTGYYIYDGFDYYNYLIMPDGNGNLDFVYYDEGLCYMATAKYTLDGAEGVISDVQYTYWVPMEGFTQEECDYLNLLAIYLQERFQIYEGETYGFKLVIVDGEDCFMLLNTEFRRAYAFDDFTALRLDGYNGAVYTDRFGDRHSGYFSAEYFSSDGGATIAMTLIRFYSAYTGEMAFLITDGKNVKVGYEFGNYTSADESIFFDGLGGVTLTDAEGVETEGEYSFDTRTDVAEITANGESFKVKLFREAGTYIVCDESLAGEYDEVDREGNKLGATLTLDGMGAAELLERGVLTHYFVEHVELSVYKLTDIEDEYNTLSVKLDAEAHTFRRSDGQTIMEPTQLFDFKNGFRIDSSVLFMIDSFDMAYMGDELVGYMTRTEQDKSDTNRGTVTYYYVTMLDGTEKIFARFLAGPIPQLSGAYNFYYAYTEYDEETDEDYQNAAGNVLSLTGFGFGKLGGNNILYWVEDGYICICDFWDQYKQTRMFSVDKSDLTCVEVTVDNKQFVVENGVLVAYLGKDDRIIIPKNMGITEIGEGVFSYAALGYYVRGIDLSGVVEIIGKNAFYPESANSLAIDTLVDVKGTDKVRIIRENAFYMADISSIRLPSIEIIETRAFYGTAKLQSVELGNAVERWYIGDEAFVGSGSSISIYAETHFTMTITALHAPVLGVNALNRADAQNTSGKIKEIIFTEASAYEEVLDAGSEAGASWAPYFAESAVTYKITGPTAGDTASIEAEAQGLYFDNRRAA